MLDVRNILTQWVTQHNLGNALFFLCVLRVLCGE